MDNYIVFNGISTKTLGVYVAEMPGHRRGAVRCEEYEIPGRNGAVVVADGYSPFDMPVTLVMLSAGAETRQAVNAWATGKGKLYTSDMPTKCWLAMPISEVTYQRREYGGKFFDTATVTFRCDPIMRQTTETAVSFTVDGTLTNPGNVVALPKIVITGNGDVSCTIAGQPVAISGMQTAHPVTIDCETGYIYTDEGAAEMTGDIPSLPLGTCNIAIGTAAKIEITPHWGWI